MGATATPYGSEYAAVDHVEEMRGRARKCDPAAEPLVYAVDNGAGGRRVTGRALLDLCRSAAAGEWAGVQFVPLRCEHAGLSLGLGMGAAPEHECVDRVMVLGGERTIDDADLAHRQALYIDPARPRSQLERRARMLLYAATVTCALWWLSLAAAITLIMQGQSGAVAPLIVGASAALLVAVVVLVVRGVMAARDARASPPWRDALVEAWAYRTLQCSV